MQNESFKIKEKILIQGYSVKIDNVEISVQRAKSELKNDNGKSERVITSPAIIKVGKEICKDNSFQGLSDKAVYELVTAGVIELTEEQKKLYHEKFYPKATAAQTSAVPVDNSKEIADLKEALSSKQKELDTANTSIVTKDKEIADLKEAATKVKK